MAADRGLVGLSIVIAVGSAAFATGMILDKRPAHKPAVQARSLDIGDDHGAMDTMAVTNGLDDDRTGSILVPDGDAGVMHPQHVGSRFQERRDGSVPSGHKVSSYVLRYADVGAALL